VTKIEFAASTYGVFRMTSHLEEEKHREEKAEKEIIIKIET